MAAHIHSRPSKILSDTGLFKNHNLLDLNSLKMVLYVFARPMNHTQFNSPEVPELFISFFLFFLRDGVQKGKGQREGDRGSEAGSVLIAESPMQDLNSA